MTNNLDGYQRQALKVIGVVNVWRGIWKVTYRLKGLRRYSELFRKVNGQWCSGEAYPQGCCSSPLRQACPEIASALEIMAK